MRGNAQAKWLAWTCLTALAAAGCSEPLPPIKIAEPLSPEEERRWNTLWEKGSESPQSLESSATTPPPAP